MEFFKLIRRRCLCMASFGLLGILSFFSPAEQPDVAIKTFVSLFLAQDAQGIFKMIHPDVINGKDMKVSDIENFLRHYKSKSLVFSSYNINRKMKSEDGKTERFEVTLFFKGPVLAKQYPQDSIFEMVLLWVLEEGKWWLERTLSINYIVISNDSYPTSAQEENALRFETALSVLDKLKLDSDETGSLVGRLLDGVATEQYKELERLYIKEKNPKGIDPKADGVDCLLKATSYKHAGFLQLYSGDFKAGENDNRKSVPWQMFNDYTQAALKRAKYLEKRGDNRGAQLIYRRIISLGRQFLSEPGGFQFVFWGTLFQKQGAEALSLLTGSSDKQKAVELAHMASRRLDLLQTALGCLDNMTDYNSLKAAITASNRVGDIVFRPLGINTLSILAIKGAPANEEAIATSGGLVIVRNQVMQNKALACLKDLESEPTGKVKSFIDRQKEWVMTHKVYDVLPSLR